MYCILYIVVDDIVVDDIVVDDIVVGLTVVTVVDSDVDNVKISRITDKQQAATVAKLPKTNI